MTDDIKNSPNRVDGIAKVTGKAKYIAEFKFANLAYGFFGYKALSRKGKSPSIDIC